MGGEFMRSSAGRLMALSIGISLILGGASTQMHGVEATFVMCIGLFVPIIINTVGLPSAFEKHWFEVILVAFLLPVFFFLYAVGIGVAREHHPEYGYGFIALGSLALILAARSPDPAHAPAPAAH